MAHKNERVEMKILKYRAIARGVTDEVTTKRIAAVIVDLQQKLREIDE
jgi:hypothetical protein